jgi:hypothetical protein
MQMIQGFHWYEYPLSWFYYLICSTVDHALVFALGCFALIFMSFLARPSYRRLFSRWAIFNVILFVIGAIISGFWDCLVYGHLYVTADYVSDFSPFIPVTQGVIDAHFDAYSGHLIGVTLRQLQFVWLLFAFVTWALASVIYLRRDRIWWYATHLTKGWSERRTAVRSH